MTLPTLHELYNPLLDALKRLGGSASVAELNNEVIRSLKLTEEDLAETAGSGTLKIINTLAWARIDLRAYGVLTSSERGILVLTPEGRETNVIDPREVRRRKKQRTRSKEQIWEEIPANELAAVPTEVVEEVREQAWQELLLETLRNMAPTNFEKLCQRLLRESGFIKVEITGKSGDGGVDGVGVVQLGGFLSFPIIFQCKRYQGSVGAGVIRDFRGAMVGRSDRGLIITTGTFTNDARKEATRDGAPPIDLVDGEQLVERLKELRLGVEVKMIEDVTIKPDWFKEI